MLTRLASRHSLVIAVGCMVGYGTLDRLGHVQPFAAFGMVVVPFTGLAIGARVSQQQRAGTRRVTATRPEGMGLGLSLSRPIIGADGGHLIPGGDTNGGIVSFTLAMARSNSEARV